MAQLGVVFPKAYTPSREIVKGVGAISGFDNEPRLSGSIIMSPQLGWLRLVTSKGYCTKLEVGPDGMHDPV